MTVRPLSEAIRYYFLLSLVGGTLGIDFIRDKVLQSLNKTDEDKEELTANMTGAWKESGISIEP